MCPFGLDLARGARIVADRFLTLGPTCACGSLSNLIIYQHYLSEGLRPLM